MSVISSVNSGYSGAQGTTDNFKTLGKDDFLQLLVTKMQYQDPLNPMDDEDFVAQLAQFSSLEQMNNIAEGIAESNQFDFLQMQSLNNTMAAGLIGKDVKADYDGIYVDQGESSQISFTLDQSVTEASFDILDQNGTIVATLTQKNLSSGANTITWDGKDKAGNTVSDGYYSVTAYAKTASGATVTPDMSLAGKVESITYRNGVAFLKVGGVEISLGDVIAIGEAGIFTSEDGGEEEF